MTKQPKCPNCGSTNVVLSTELEDVQFWINENGRVDFEASDIRDELEHCLKWTGGVICECEECWEHWDYEKD